MAGNGGCADVLTFWEALHVRGLARQLLCVMGSLEDLDDELEGPCRGARFFLADALEGLDTEAAGLLRDNDRVKVAP